MKKYIAPFFFVAAIGNAQATEITNTSATGTTFKFTATLNAPLTAGNKVKIDFGKGGLKAMTCSAKTCTLSSNVLPTGISTATYKIGIYDAKNVLQGSTSDGTYVITSTPSAPVSNYTKIANDGSELPDGAKFGSNPKDWACTKDNKTGLIWEVKTTDGGLRDMAKTYTNYSISYPSIDGKQGKYGDSRNSDIFVSEVNKQTLCGVNTWRLPTKGELLGLIYCSDGKYTPVQDEYLPLCINWKNVTKPTINTIYFPNTPIPNISVFDMSVFWSSSPYILKNGYTWGIYFGMGGSDWLNEDYNYIRLVH